MIKRQFAAWDMEHLGQIEPERDPSGRLIELFPQERYKDAATTQLHAYGAGPFCRFRIGRGRKEAGLYVLTVDDAPVYAGECQDVGRRWGPNGYGGISPRNCFVGGQPTNCRLNALILQQAKAGRRIDLWFTAVGVPREERQNLERCLIRHLNPDWNIAGRY